MFDGYILKSKILKRIFSNFRSDTEKVLANSDEITQKHNEFCMFSLLVAMYASGARPVNDPLANITTDHLKYGIVELSDKEVIENSSLHYVGLGEIATQQVNNYHKHLMALATQYRTQSGSQTNLFRGILRKAQGHRNSSLPFFFLINDGKTESITPKIIEKYLSRQLSLPANFGRHVMATFFSDTYDCKNTSAFLETSAFLGHQPLGQHLFGRESELCQIDSLQHQAKANDSFFKSIGLTPLKGLKPHRSRDIYDLSLKKESNLHKTKELGHDKRRRLREEKINADIQLAKEVLTYLKAEPSTKRQLPKIKTLREDIQHSYYPVGSHWQTLIEQYWDSKSFKIIFPTSKRKLHLAISEQPFKDKSLSSYFELKKAREDWLNFLAQSHNSNQLEACSERIAAVIITAALFGGFFEIEKLELLYSSLDQHTYLTKAGVLYIELVKESVGEDLNLGRWIPDRLSQCLIIGLRNQLKKSKSSFPEKSETLEKITILLENINIKTSREQCLKRLVAISGSATKFEYPSYLSQYYLGSTGTHIDHQAWVRLTTGLVSSNSRENATPLQVGDWLPTLSKNKIINNDLLALRAEVSNVLIKAANQGRRGKNELVTNLKTISQKYPNAPSIGHLVIAWGVSVCVKGTARAGLNVATSTIKNYVTLVMDALFRVEEACDFFSCDDIGFEYLYRSAVDGASQQNQATLVVQLQLFHAWVINNYDVEDCEWSNIWREANHVKPIVSANLITEVEYQRAFELVVKDESLVARTRTQYLSLLILLRKFGLRFGEAFQLRKQDIQHTKDWSYIVVQINRIGGREVKTESGIRQVANLEKLTSSEITVIKDLTCHDFLSNHESPIMAISTNSNERLNKVGASSYLNKIVKVVSGDPSVSLKHFRHGYCSQVHAKILNNRYKIRRDKIKPWLDREINLYNLTEDTITRPVKSLSLSLGHSAIQTTIHSYTHSLDIVPHEGDRLDVETVFSAKALAYVFGESYEAYRKRKLTIDDRLIEYTIKLKLPTYSDHLELIGFNIEAAREQLEQGSNYDVTPSLIADIFFYISSSSPQKKFTHKAFVIDRKQFWEICNIGDQLENDTNFDDYILANFVLPIGERIKPITHANMAEHVRIKNFLDKFESHIYKLYDEKNNLLKDVFSIWCLSVNPEKYQFEINLRDRIEKLSQFFEQFLIELKMSNFTKGTNNGSFKRRSIRRERKSLRPQINYKLNFNKLLSNENASINNEKDLHKVLFILTVWFRYKDLNCGRKNDKSL